MNSSGVALFAQDVIVQGVAPGENVIAPGEYRAFLCVNKERKSGMRATQ